MITDINALNFGYPLRAIDSPEEDGFCKKIYNYTCGFFERIGSAVINSWRWLVCIKDSATESDSLDSTTQVFQQTMSPENSTLASQQSGSQVTSTGIPLTGQQRILQDFVGIVRSGANSASKLAALLEILNFIPDEELSEVEIREAASSLIVPASNLRNMIQGAIERNQGVSLQEASIMVEDVRSETVKSTVQFLLENQPEWQINHCIEIVATYPEQHSIQERFQAFRDMMDIVPDDIETEQRNINFGLKRVHSALLNNEETSEMVHRLQEKWGSYGNTNRLHTKQQKIDRGDKLFFEEHCSDRIKEKLSRFIEKEFPPQG